MRPSKSKKKKKKKEEDKEGWNQQGNGLRWKSSASKKEKAQAFGNIYKFRIP